ALFNKDKLADTIFKDIELKYNNVKELAKTAKRKPKVLSGVMYKDKWNMPAGDSFGAQLLRDANVNYPWQKSIGTGSLSLSFEAVFDKARDAEIWISPGFFSSFNQLKESNKHYTKFDAFQNKNIYNSMNRKGETGGVLYYELAPVQPHIVLKDIIKVMHPNLLPQYELYYFQQLN
ncbi:MAG: ABC transporter substrate-binding protein, partial [Flavobacteriaceae bacterium]